MQTQSDLAARIREIYEQRRPDHIDPYIGEAFHGALPDHLRVLCIGINTYISPGEWERRKAIWFAEWFKNQKYRFSKGAVRAVDPLAAAVTAPDRLFAGLTFDWRKSLYVTNAVKVYVTEADGKRAEQVGQSFAAHETQWRDEITALIDAGVPPHVVVVFGKIFWPAFCKSFGHEGVLAPRVAAREGETADAGHRLCRITLIGGHVMLLVRLNHPSRPARKLTAENFEQLPSFSRTCTRPPAEALNDAEVLKERTRTRLEGDATVFDVGTVEWLGPHTPRHSWHEVARLPASASEAEVDGHRRQLLAREDLFVICVSCGRRELLGHTHDRKCHACMERDGVVF
jgi:hypothetical protein